MIKLKFKIVVSEVDKIFDKFSHNVSKFPNNQSSKLLSVSSGS